MTLAPTKSLSPPTTSSDRPRFVSTLRAEKWWIEKSRASLYHYIWYVSGKKPPPHMLSWIEALLIHDRINIVASRGFAKTSYAVYALTWLIAKNSFDTHYIGSVSAKQSEDRLEMAREIIDTNLRFKNVFPNIQIDYQRTCNKSEFTVLDASYANYGTYRSAVGMRGDPKNPTVFACGVGSSALIGRRISGLALIDDIHSEANSATADLRQKVNDWFNRTFMGCLKDKAKVLVICTRWSIDDHSGRLMDLKGIDGLPIWKSIVTASETNGVPNWQEEFPRERLDKIVSEIGPVMYGLMFLCDPTTLSTGQFTIDMLRRDLPDILPDDLEVIISTDLAFTTKSASDYCVFAAIGKSVNGKLIDFYVLDMEREKYQFHGAIDALITFIHKINERWPVTRVLFENQAMTLNSFLEYQSREPGFAPKLVTARGDKGVRLSELALKGQRGGLFINQQMSGILALRSEFIGYPRVDHDDTIDALGLPIFYWNASDKRAGIIYLTTNIPDAAAIPQRSLFL
jgi:phage terminase large subunit-like protein